MNELKIESFDHPSGGGVVVVSVSGPADLAGLPFLERNLNALAQRKPQRVVFDLSALTFIASLSIGAIIAFHNAANRWGGKVSLAGANDMIANTLKRVRIDAMLPVYPSLDEAVKAN